VVLEKDAFRCAIVCISFGSKRERMSECVLNVQVIV